MGQKEPQTAVLGSDLLKELKLRSSVIRFDFRKSMSMTFKHISELEGDLKSQDISLGDYYKKIRGEIETLN